MKTNKYRSKKPKPVELVYQQFGLCVRAIRETLGIDQGELAKRIGQTRASVANLEAGRQRCLLHDIETYAVAFGISPKAIMRGIWT